MTNEAVKVELTNGTGFPRRFLVEDSKAITKGTLLRLTDGDTGERGAVDSSAAGDAIAGIASMDKEANNGDTHISVWTDGIFSMYASGAIVRGSPVMSAGVANEVKAAWSGATQVASGASVIGYALQKASDKDTINVRIRL